MSVARRDVYNANLRAEEAQAREEQAEVSAGEAIARAEQAEASAGEAIARAEQAEAAAREAIARAEQAEASAGEAIARAERAEASADEVRARAEQAETGANRAQIERYRALQQLDAMRHSTVWQATWLVRVVGHRLPSGPRRALRGGLKVGWWSLTLKLRRKLRERHLALASQSASTTNSKCELSANSSSDRQKCRTQCCVGKKKLLSLRRFTCRR